MLPEEWEIVHDVITKTWLGEPVPPEQLETAYWIMAKLAGKLQ